MARTLMGATAAADLPGHTAHIPPPPPSTCTCAREGQIPANPTLAKLKGRTEAGAATVLLVWKQEQQQQQQRQQMPRRARWKDEGQLVGLQQQGHVQRLLLECLGRKERVQTLRTMQEKGQEGWGSLGVQCCTTLSGSSGMHLASGTLSLTSSCGPCLSSVPQVLAQAARAAAMWAPGAYSRHCRDTLTATGRTMMPRLCTSQRKRGWSSRKLTLQHQRSTNCGG
mmetsp:Transcript_7903/g.19386  ORF Transcript_7903/g.19386 Transcript_7903/m.19386 type:complete len:225 (+) Transcript_7903:2810-3484(+)